jgi:hypothetical protein
MEEVNKNTELDNTDKKLHISGVSCRFCGSSNFDECYIDTFKIHSPRFDYDVESYGYNFEVPERRIEKTIKIRICECGVIVKKNDN